MTTDTHTADSPDGDPPIAVLGGGLTGHVAAAALRDQGCTVLHVYPASPGQTALWSGLGRIFGPARRIPASSTGQKGDFRQTGGSAGSSFARSRERRFQRLLDRRSHHPYQVTNASVGDLNDALDRSLGLLSELDLVRLPDETTLPDADGAPAVADVVPDSMVDLQLRAGDTVHIVKAPGLGGWDAESLAAGVSRADDVHAEPVDAPIFEELDGGHPVRCATQLDETADARGQICGWLGDRPSDVDVVIWPPCLGANPDRHAAWSDRLTGRPVADSDLRAAAGTIHRHPAVGWRLDRQLRELQPPDIERRVTAIQVDDAGHAVALYTDDRRVEISGVVLATGSFASGSLRASPPLRESITDAPLFLDGSPLPEPASRRISEFLKREPWSDHRLWRLGVGVDSNLRILDQDARPIADNLVAAGRILAGTNRITDGTAFGVDLWTGLRAADSIRRE